MLTGSFRLLADFCFCDLAAAAACTEVIHIGYLNFELDYAIIGPTNLNSWLCSPIAPSQSCSCFAIRIQCNTIFVIC